MEFLRVTIDFDQSHLFFPRIVGWVLVVLLCLALVARRRELVRAAAGLRGSLGAAIESLDLKTFGGTIGLLIAYIVVMDRLSDVWPNTGLSFLVCSMVFMASLSLLYLHDRTRRKVAFAIVCAVLAPFVVWYALAKLFFLTLP